VTLVIAAQGSGFLILGTDSKETVTNAARNRIELNNQIKLVKINNKVGILMYGETQIPDYLIEKFKEELSRKNMNVTDIAENFASFCRNEARKTYDVRIARFPLFGFVIAGLDKKGRKYIPRCFNLESGTGFSLGLYSEKFAIEGKPFLALYLFSKKYRQNMSVEELSELVAEAFHDTKKIDGDVGGETKMARIDETGFIEYTKEAIDDLVKELD